MSEYNGYKETLQRNNLIMLAPAGSELLGLAQEEGKSDKDEMGISLETDKQLIGFQPFEQDIYRSAEERDGKDSKSKAGDIDLVIYGLRKFVRLALSGNPNLIGMLFIPKKLCTVYTETAAELQALAPRFISKSVSKAFLGYMKSQRMRLMGLKGQRNVIRSEFEREYGFDVKYAMHLIRLGIQGVGLADKGTMSFPLNSEFTSYLRGVRNGDTSYDQIIKDATYYETQLEESLQMSVLPEYPDTAAIEAWLLDTYKKAWNANKTPS